MQTWAKLLFIISLVLGFPPPSLSAPARHIPPYHIETQFVQRVQCVVDVDIRFPNADPTEFGLVAPSPPDTDGQRVYQATMAAEGWNAMPVTFGDLSNEYRGLMRLTLPVTNQDKHRLRGKITYVIDLFSRLVVPGPPRTQVTPLPDSDRLNYTATFGQLDYDKQSFRDWLDANGVHRQSGETDINFAFRTAGVIRGLYNYEYIPSQYRYASALCRAKSTDCGGLSTLFVSALRANDIPARLLVGHVAISHKDGVVDYNQRHVRSEFWAEGVGWILVDESYIVGSKSAPIESNFGNDPGDFVTFHIDPNLMFMSQHFGIQEFSLQSPYWEVFGPGSLKDKSIEENWTVTKLF